MRSFGLCVSLALVAALVPLQLAHSSPSAQHESDANDSGGVPDLERVSLDYGSGEFTVTIRSYDKWVSTRLKGPNRFISARFSRRQASEPRRLLTIDYKHGGLVAKIEDTSQGAPAPVIDRPDPKRPDRKSVRVSFDRDNWGRLGKRIFWNISVAGRCNSCSDNAPDDGSYFVYKF